MEALFKFLDKHQWACWMVIVAGILMVSAIEGTDFPYPG